ncbi:MAG: hypothetical protein BWK80_40220 [Desulfobacteraceae bacterium IS3]|nr:MAG: hypothetical protein BWK80_40220 [Desulfobacteraceae bacterium IS3]HAO21790.1 hypothetical protein [Desulfobacteraceae bacterium]
MANEKSEFVTQIENRFSDIGGFTWEQAEAWAGFCNSVGMDPMPFLKVLLNNICSIKVVSAREFESNSNPACPELRILFKGSRTKFKAAEPKPSSRSGIFACFGI